MTPKGNQSFSSCYNAHSRRARCLCASTMATSIFATSTQVTTTRRSSAYRTGCVLNATVQQSQKKTSEREKTDFRSPSSHPRPRARYVPLHHVVVSCGACARALVCVCACARVIARACFLSTHFFRTAFFSQMPPVRHRRRARRGTMCHLVCDIVPLCFAMLHTWRGALRGESVCFFLLFCTPRSLDCRTRWRTVMCCTVYPCVGQAA